MRGLLATVAPPRPQLRMHQCIAFATLALALQGTFLEVRRADAALVEQIAELFAAAAAGGMSAASAAASCDTPAAAAPPHQLLSTPYVAEPYSDSALSLQMSWQGLSLHDNLPVPDGGPWLPDYSVPDPYAAPASPPVPVTEHAPLTSNGTAATADAGGGWVAAVAAAPRRRQQQQEQPAAPAPEPAAARMAKQSPQESDLVDDPRW